MAHFTLDERITIATSLKQMLSISEIAVAINKSPSSVLREIKRHATIKSREEYFKNKNDCIHRYDCKVKQICSPRCTYQNGNCRFCGQCNSHCSKYEKEICQKLIHSPHVCNGCSKSNYCILEQIHYKPQVANQRYRTMLVETRKGFNLTEKELDWLNTNLGELVSTQKQSIHHACIVLKDSMPCDERTVYSLIDANMLPKVKNINLPRKCKLKTRKNTSKRYKVDKTCRINRTYLDFELYCKEHNPLVVEMDTVEGTKGGKCIISFLFKSCNLQLYYLVDDHTSQKVIDIFNYLYNLLGHSLFSSLFEAVLTDNGPEFSNPRALEYASEEQIRSHIFYCDPASSYQKGSCENNHEMLRRFLPKGTSFDDLTQDQLNIISSHINSYKRKKLNNLSPIEIFSFAYNEDVIHKLGIQKIPPDKVTLDLSVLK